MTDTLTIDTPTLTDEQRANVEAWCTALESGDYEQGRGMLCQDGKFCCLGVAAEASGVKWRAIANGARGYYMTEGTGLYSDFLPEDTWFEERYGFRISRHFIHVSDDGEVNYETLYAYNDGETASFPDRKNRDPLPHPEIAKMIRREILGEDV